MHSDSLLFSERSGLRFTAENGEVKSDPLRKMSRGKSKLWPHHAWSNQRFHSHQQNLLMLFRYANRLCQNDRRDSTFLEFYTKARLSWSTSDFCGQNRNWVSDLSNYWAIDRCWANLLLNVELQSCWVTDLLNHWVAQPLIYCCILSPWVATETLSAESLSCCGTKVFWIPLGK